jgi:hypothetical protein
MSQPATPLVLGAKVGITRDSLADVDLCRPLARICRYMYGPQNGRWAWFVLVAPDGAPFNGGIDSAATGPRGSWAVSRRAG